MNRLVVSTLALALALAGARPRLVLYPGALDRFAASAAADTLEELTCLIGTRVSGVILIVGTAPAKVDTARTTRTRITLTRGCRDASDVVGIMHSHPLGQNCWYFFPTTVVGTSDAASAARSPYPIDAIWCRGTIVWMYEGKEHVEASIITQSLQSPPGATLDLR